MLLPPRLRDATLGDVLASLFRARASGALELDAGGRTHAVHLRGGLVVAVDGPAPRFGDLAAELGLAHAAAVERAWRERRTAHRIGQCLVAARVLSPRDRDRVLEAQRVAGLEVLFRLHDAALRLRPTQRLPDGAAEQAPMVPSKVLRGRPRARDRAAPRPADPVRADALDALGLPPEATDAEARERFRALVMELHPDRAVASARAAERELRLRAVLDAWRRLHAA